MISFHLSTLAVAAAAITALSIPRAASAPCDSARDGYECQIDISHNWGQYSPYFTVPSNISADIPPQCVVTFAQILSRHGARDPTASKTTAYNATILKIHNMVKNYTGSYSFLANYQYTLGADQLTNFGQQEMVNSGIKFFKRYPYLSSALTPFVRSSSEARVVESAQNWTQGFHQAKTAEYVPDPNYPYNITILSEDAKSNNTLNHALCTAFENGTYSTVAASAQAQWANTFVPPIQARLNANLPGANLSQTETIYMMDLCPFNTVASPNGTISPFCSLFTPNEWKQYGYYESLNKYYGFGAGNPLGPTQGVGFTNELIARMSNQPVIDHTSTNRTLDSSSITFSLGRQLYADFSHDNDMTAIFFAMGLYNSTATLSNTSTASASQLNGYSAAYTVPFAARAYFEKLRCTDRPSEELVRVIVNDRVIPLVNCGADSLGRCGLTAWVNSLSFARGGGKWSQCFK